MNERAVEKVLDGKDIGGLEIRTGDLRGKATTVEVGDAVCGVLAELLDGVNTTSVGTLADDVQKAKLGDTPLSASDAHVGANQKWEKAIIDNDQVSTGPHTAIASS